MVIKAFPSLEHADSNGLLAIGGDLEPESLLLAYKQGIFPWPLDQETLAWFSPPHRAILEFEDLHISKSLSRLIKKNNFEFTVNKAFPAVIDECSKLTNRKLEYASWITEPLIEAYCRLFELGFCFSIESWQQGKLVGGIYGIKIANFVAGESMFYRVPNASKLAMCFLVEYFSALGIKWLDCQVMTPHMQAFGAKLITRKQFIKKLGTSLS